MNFKQSLIVAAVFNSFCMGSAFAAESAILTVTGTIKPGACTPRFTTGNTIDYGVIPASSLLENGLNNRPVTFEIMCQGAKHVAFKAIDDRAGHHVQHEFGLGVDDQGKHIGNFRIYVGYDSFGMGAGDGKDAAIIFTTRTPAANQIWTTTLLGDGSRDENLIVPGRYYALANDENGYGPGAYTNHTFHGFLRTDIATHQLDLSKQINLDGSATFELHYL